MCGINGFTGDFGPAARDLVGRMNAMVAYRGPDDEGIYIDPAGAFGFGHRRLSILDLSPAGHQPMADPAGVVHLVFNGEIYNFQALRSELEAKGHRFRSHTDTETLIYLYLEYGEAMLERLQGMFAFALWDTRTATLFAARDHFGIKPFYYTQLSDGRLLFGSEIKSLLTCPEVRRAIHLPALADFFSFLWVSDPVTMFEGIQKLPPGHKLRWHDGRLHVESWWDLDYSGGPSDRSEAELLDELTQRLDTAVRRQLVSDVPVGAFLSGGLDSSGIVAAMTRAQRGDVRCYTMALDEQSNRIEQVEDDLPYARQVAAHLGVSLHEVRVGPEIASLWPKMVWHLDEPLADPAAINCYLISKLAREDGVTVLLSGQGADELFAGYRRYQGPVLMGRLGRLPRPLARSLAAGSRLLPGSSRGKVGGLMRRSKKLLAGAGLSADEQYVLYCQWMSRDDRVSLLRPEIEARVGVRDPEELTRALIHRFPGAPPLHGWLYRDTKTFLPALNLTYTDKCGMATSVECRVPYLDVDLAEFAARIPAALKLNGSVSKYLLKKSLASGLPPAILDRPKTGFGLPLRTWIRGELSEMVDDLVSRESVRRRGLFRWESVERIRRQVDRGSGDYAYTLWALITLELWHRTFLDPAAIVPPQMPADLPTARGPG